VNGIEVHRYKGATGGRVIGGDDNEEHIWRRMSCYF
jgi:hypothetical protein